MSKDRRKKIIFCSKLTILFYLSIFSIGYLVSDTEAYYHSSSKQNMKVTAGYWEDAGNVSNQQEYTSENIEGFEVDNETDRSNEPDAPNEEKENEELDGSKDIENTSMQGGDVDD